MNLVHPPCEDPLMLRLLRLLFILSVRSFRSRRELVMENLALRQQPYVWKRRRPQPRIRYFRAHPTPLDAKGASRSRTSRRWIAFLSNHRDAPAAKDFFTVPTVNIASQHRRRVFTPIESCAMGASRSSSLLLRLLILALGVALPASIGL